MYAICYVFIFYLRLFWVCVCIYVYVYVNLYIWVLGFWDTLNLGSELTMDVVCLLTVRLLQAIKWLWLHLSEPNNLDQNHRAIQQHGLWCMAERSKHSLLQLPSLQGWTSWQHQELVEEGRYCQHCLPHLPHHCLLCRLLCLPEQQAR